MKRLYLIKISLLLFLYLKCVKSGKYCVDELCPNKMCMDFYNCAISEDTQTPKNFTWPYKEGGTCKDASDCQSNCCVNSKCSAINECVKIVSIVCIIFSICFVFCCCGLFVSYHKKK